MTDVSPLLLLFFSDTLGMRFIIASQVASLTRSVRSAVLNIPALVSQESRLAPNAPRWMGFSTVVQLIFANGT